MFAVSFDIVNIKKFWFSDSLRKKASLLFWAAGKMNGIKMKSWKLRQQQKVEEMTKLTKNWLCLIDCLTAWRLFYTK
jgi:hypothetical protein